MHVLRLTSIGTSFQLVVIIQQYFAEFSASRVESPLSCLYSSNNCITSLSHCNAGGKLCKCGTPACHMSHVVKSCNKYDLRLHTLHLMFISSQPHAHVQKRHAPIAVQARIGEEKEILRMTKSVCFSFHVLSRSLYRPSVFKIRFTTCYECKFLQSRPCKVN